MHNGISLLLKYDKTSLIKRNVKWAEMSQYVFSKKIPNSFDVFDLKD